MNDNVFFENIMTDMTHDVEHQVHQERGIKVIEDAAEMIGQ